MQFYKLRCDLENTSYEDVVSLVKRDSTTYMGCYEVIKSVDGDSNPHCHFYLETVVKQATLRQRLRKLVGKGNRNYSLKDLDGEQYPIEYLGYLVKGEELIHVGIPESVLSEAKEYDAQVKKQIKERKEKRKSRYTRLDEAFTSTEEYKAKMYDANYIIEFVIDFMSKEPVTVSVSTIESHCNTLLLKYDDTYKRELSCVISKRLFSRI